MALIHGRAKWWASQATAQGTNRKGQKDVTEIFRNMVQANSGFHTRKNFSENYSQFGHTTSNR
jgi:hypothetical protein